jgi:hypothetical protein
VSSEPLKGKAHLFVAVGRTSKLVFVRLYRKANKLAAQAFLKVLIRTVPYKIHTIAQRSAGGMPGKAGLGSPTTACSSPSWPALASRSWCTRSLRLCWANGIEHRLTKPYHPLRRLLPAALAGIGSMACPSGSSEPDSAADG